jgi:hypothetical protein
MGIKSGRFFARSLGNWSCVEWGTVTMNIEGVFSLEK